MLTTWPPKVTVSPVDPALTHAWVAYSAAHVPPALPSSVPPARRAPARRQRLLGGHEGSALRGPVVARQVVRADGDATIRPDRRGADMELDHVADELCPRRTVGTTGWPAPTASCYFGVAVVSEGKSAYFFGLSLVRTA